MEFKKPQYNGNFKEKKLLHIEDYNLEVKVDKILNRIVRKEGFKSYGVSKRIFKDIGNSFLSVLFEADIKADIDGAGKEINLFGKFKVPGEKLPIVSMSDAYLRELYIYKELSVILAELQNKFGVPEDERYKFAKFYDESDKESIIMDNLSKKGFKTYHRMDVISLEFANVAVKELAKFHAMSFALEKIEPLYFKNKCAIFKHPLIFNDYWTSIATNICDTIMTHLDEDVKTKFEKFIPRLLEMYKKYVEDETCIRCICHGDYRAANIMMKEVNGKINIIPIDYQIIHYGNPIYDFLYFIFGATDQAFRRTNLSHLKELYYEELKKFLRYFRLDVEMVFPLKEFEKYFKERLDFGLIAATIMIPFTLASDEAVPDIASGEEVNFNTGMNDVCKTRLTGLIEDFIDWGYL